MLDTRCLVDPRPLHDASAASVVLELPCDLLLTTHSMACWKSTIDPSWDHDGPCPLSHQGHQPLGDSGRQLLVDQSVQLCRFALDPSRSSLPARVSRAGVMTGAGSPVNGLIPRRPTGARVSRCTRSGAPQGRTPHHPTMAFGEEYSTVQPFSQEPDTDVPTIASISACMSSC